TVRDASCVRQRLGLPHALISVGAGPEAVGPDVAWQCAFPTSEAHQRDLEARATSAEFDAVRAEMGALLARFERHVWRTDETSGNDADPLEGHPIVPRVVGFPSGSLPLTGYLYTPPGPGPFPCLVTNHGRSIHQRTPH